MNKALRLSEKWFRYGLWLVAFAFGSFLIGLGGTVVRNLPKVEYNYVLEDFIDTAAADQARASIKAAKELRQQTDEALEQEKLQLNARRADSARARETFHSWLATRQVTQSADQDSELMARRGELDEFAARTRQALAAVERQQQIALDAKQAEQRAQRELSKLEDAAQDGLSDARKRQVLRVFLYRLALTLPLLAIAGWLLLKKRKASWWPFVWGFAYFAVFAFFVELVPYLPDYGGAVRNIVGVVVTVIVGRQAIVALNRYLERQKEAEARPDALRRQELGYDMALSRLAKGVCPGCERTVDFKDGAIDYCPHCGICLFDRCAKCKQRKSAFSRFCHACGAAPHDQEGEETSRAIGGNDR